MPHKKHKAKKKSKNNIIVKDENVITKIETTNNTEKIEEVKQIEDNNENKDNNDNEDNSNNLDEIIKAFEYFDINHSGKIHITDLTRILSTFGDVMKEEEMENIFKSAGIIINSDEQVDYIKFIKFWFGNK